MRRNHEQHQRGMPERRVVTQADRDSRSKEEMPLFETAEIGKGNP